MEQSTPDEASEESQRAYQPKHCVYNNKNKVNSLNILSNHNQSFFSSINGLYYSRIDITSCKINYHDVLTVGIPFILSCHLSLLIDPLDDIRCLHKAVEYGFVCWPTLVSSCVQVNRGMLLMSLSTSLPMPSMFCSSYSEDLWDGRQVAIQLLFSRVLLSGFVQHSMQHFCAVPIYINTSLESKQGNYAGVHIWPGRISALFDERVWISTWSLTCQ